MKTIPIGERGATLIVTLIMLLLMTLMVITAANLGGASMQAVGNMQQRDQVRAAVDETFEEIVSSTRFTDTPTAVFLKPCTVANSKCVDINGDGLPDVTVTLTVPPACVKAQVVPASALDLSKPSDAGCAVGSAQETGVAGMASGGSLCADSTWEITAVGKDNITQASVTETQGVAIRVSTDNIPAGC